MKTSDFISIEQTDGIATLWIDHQLESMNVVSPAVIEIFEEVFNEIESDDAIKASILISRKKDFIAGADIKSFAIEKEGDFRPYQEKGHDMLARLEKSDKPVVAAIHGACMGLGTELILACHARVAADHPATRFALPEVRLGLLPGGGGTQRLPRRVGIQRALDMMLTGRNIYAYQAKKMGLVDELTALRKLHHAATITAQRLLEGEFKRKTRKTLLARLLEDNTAGRGLLFNQARKQAFRQSQGNYPAVPAILECVEAGYKEGIGSGYEKELEHFERLMLTPESEAMRTLFFAMTDNKKNPFPKKEIRPLRTLGMIGAGFMGAGIAEVSIHGGVQVLLKDIKEDMIAEARKGIWKGIEKKIKRKALGKTEGEGVMGRLQAQLTYQQFEQADIVIEAVLEKMSLKKQIIDEVQKNGKKEVIIATNTSSLSVTEMAQHAANPGHVVGMHYFSPVPKMPLLEIVRTPQTEDWVLASCYDLGVRQGKTCIIVQDSPGFYVNRILAPYMNEALVLLDEGITMSAIDRAMKKMGFPVGPITLFDQVGLDIAAHVVESSKKIVEGRDGFTVHDGVVRMFEEGRRGKKNRKGFYVYDAATGKKKHPDETAYRYFKGKGNKEMPLKDLQDRLLLLMINEAVHCLQESIIQEPADGDLGAVFGIGFLPFVGGPFRYVDKEGVPQIVARMKELADRVSPRFEPAQTLLDMEKANKKFYR